MKVIQINCVYGKGSTGKITEVIHKGLLERGVDSLVIYGRGQRPKEERLYKPCYELMAKFNNLASRVSGIMYGGCHSSTRKIIKIIKSEKPDIVHLQCINGHFVNIYKLVKWLNENNIPTVLTHHADFMFTANCSHSLECEKWKNRCSDCQYWKKNTKSFFINNTEKSFDLMKDAFENFKYLKVVSVSPWLQGRSKDSKIFANYPNSTVMNGLDTEVFCLMDKRILKKRYGFEGKRVVFHPTSSFKITEGHIKGGSYILKLAEIMPECIFIVAGRSENISQQLKDKYKNLLFWGEVKNQNTLAELYNIADVTVLTSQRETFSMVLAESLCCGTPVAGFLAGGPESISIDKYCKFSPQGKIEELAGNLRKLIDDKPDSQTIAEEASIKYSTQTMVDKYLKEYEEILCKAKP